MIKNPNDNKPRDFKTEAPTGPSAEFPTVVYASEGSDHKKVNNQVELDQAKLDGYFRTPAPGSFGVPAEKTADKKSIKPAK